ncbi:MAG: class I SAM-dependent methyltransferase [Thermotogae bacterium]|jgi:ubiquinone/menaquinone biosynthesis C-methylase UbiE|nr:class I SAM-dependent methyltransferase [Thermotogota bacterium]
MKTQVKYDIFSKFYDLVEEYMEEKSFSKWRKIVWERVPPGSKVLEIGVGTGKNIPYYPNDVEIEGIDFSQGMLERAISRSTKYPDKKIKLMRMDVSNMSFPESSFDFVIATFVFCTVPDPVLGFKETIRVLKPHGKAIFLEHMRSNKWIYNIPLYMINPVIKTLTGTSVIRKTKENILNSGFKILEEKNLFSDIVKLLICEKI